MKPTKLVAALAVIMMMTILAAPTISAEDSVDLTATVLEPKPEIAIELSTNALSFGSLYPGNTSDPQDLTVTNIGLKDIDVTATASDDGTEPLFVLGLLIDSAAYGDYSAILAADEFDDTQLALHVPDEYAARGAVTGGATFWAEEHLYLPGADFSASPVSGDVPLDVQFTDLSTNSPTSWSWDFDSDGTIDSTEQNPSHTYTAAGSYSISLTATNSYGSDTVTKSAYVSASTVKINIYSSARENTNAGAPDPGISGTSSVFVAWAGKVIEYSPSPQDIQAQFTDPSLALGLATGGVMDIVSLGDLDQDMIDAGENPGSLTLGFNVTIVNGDGPDFAAFENGFMSGDGLFAELGYVEVSTDGITFARFPSVSLTSLQPGGYGTIDSTYLYNLVGKHANAYGSSYGTPFDLSDLAQSPEVLNGSVDLNNINYVRIVDIPGNGDYKDSLGNPIYDAWPTVGSGGLDMEALGVINAKQKAIDADFSADMTGGDAPLTVHFADQSTNSPTSWSWDLDDDGNVDSTEQNPSYTYTTPGTYTVRLTVSNAEGIDEVFKVTYITVNTPLFTYTSDGSSITITDYTGPSGDVVIPSTINDLPVTAIGTNAFRFCTTMTSVVIPDSVTSIGDRAFEGCIALISIVIPDSVTNIGTAAFIDCTALTSVTIGSGVTSIGQDTFYGCTALATVTLGSGITSIKATAFEYCTALTSIVIPDSVTSIGANAFRGCTALTTVNIPDSVTSIGSSAFYGCAALTSVTIGSGVMSIGDSAFQGCTALTTIWVDTNNTAYASVDGILYNKSIITLALCPAGKVGSVTIPDSVTSIGTSAFYGCTALTTVTIGSGVTSIGKNAFRGCIALTSMTFEGNAPTVGSNWALNVPSTMIVYYHQGATGFTNPWNGFTTVELSP